MTIMMHLVGFYMNLTMHVVGGVLFPHKSMSIPQQCETYSVLFAKTPLANYGF